MARYDAYGERVVEIDGRGLDVTGDATPTVTLAPNTASSYTARYGYDAQGDQTSASTPPITTTLNGITTTAPVTTTQGYDGDGNQTAVASANGNTTTSAYDHLGRQISTTLPPVKLYDNTTTTPVETTGYDGDGNTVASTDALGAMTTSSYDPLGRQVVTTNPVSGTMLMTYTATELAATQDMAGNISRDAYDGAGRLILASDPATGTIGYGYDAVGNTAAIAAGDSSGNVTQRETRGYDAWNHTITDTVGGSGSPALTTLTAYDLDGNVEQVEQPNGNTTYNNYDLADQLTEQLLYPHPLGAPGANDAAYSAYGYDGAGNVTVSIDADGRDTATTLDGDNRTVQEASVTGDGTTVITTTMGYDPDGNTLRQTQQTQGPTGGVQTHTITNTYNAADWETATSDDGLATGYGYDAAGQRRSETIMNGSVPVTRALDAEGRLTSVAENAGGTGPYTSTIGYNQNDLVTGVNAPGGMAEQAGYDPNSRLISVTATGPNTGSGATTLNSAYVYGYDALNRLTALTTTVNGAITSTQFMHDAQGRLTRWSGQVNGPEAWGYDGNGNIVTNTEDIGGLQRSSVYTYSAMQPNEEVQGHTAGFGVEYRTYDQNGDTMRITSTDPLTSPFHLDEQLWYDSQARPLTITTLQGGVPITVTMGYNADGQRARYTVTMSGTATLDERFQYRGGQLAQMAALTTTLTGGGAIQSTGAYTDSYVYGATDAPLELLRQRGSTTSRYWYTLDGRGNVVALTDSTGAVVDRYAYDPYGENLPEGTNETIPQQLRYASYWFDAALGWYWVGARSYDPEGRWMQPDPSQADGLRTYVYADDDPVDETDALGLGGICDVPLFGGAACAVGALAHGAYDLIAGDDIKTLQDKHKSGVDKFLAVVDLTSNVLIFVPIFGESVEGAKLAVNVAVKVGSHIITREVKYDTAVGIVKQLARRGARGAVEGAAEACALCFPAGTLVATSHGMHAIDTLRIGDTVLSENPTTGKVEAEAVQAVIADPVSPLIAVDLSDGSAITVTADHPFWLDGGLMVGKAGWIQAGDLVLGDRLRTPSGQDVAVLGVQRGVGRAAVYTLTVAKDHTFFVGTAKVLVHNADCFDPKFYTQLEQQLNRDGPRSILKTLRSLERRLDEHQAKVGDLQYKSSVEHEIQVFQTQIATVRKFIQDHGITP